MPEQKVPETSIRMHLSPLNPGQGHRIVCGRKDIPRGLYHAIHWRGLLNQQLTRQGSSQVVQQLNVHLPNENLKRLGNRPHIQGQPGSVHQPLLLAQLYHPKVERTGIDLHRYIRVEGHLIRRITNI